MYVASLVAGLLLAAIGIYVFQDAVRKEPVLLMFFARIRANRGLAAMYGGLVATFGLAQVVAATLFLTLG